METRVVALIIFDLFIIFVAAKIAAELFERVGQPAVIGELLAGVIIGPSVLGLIGSPSGALVELFTSELGFIAPVAKEAAKETNKLIFEVLAEIGVVILLFKVGLETNLSALIKLGGRAMSVAILGVIFPFVLGGGLAYLVGRTTSEILFVGAAMVATSVGITARVLSDLGRLQTSEGRVILGAAVIDDVLGLLVLTVVLGLARPGTGGSVPISEIIGLVVVAFGFIIFTLVVGVFGIRRYSIHFEKLRIHNPAFAISLAVCLGMAALAAQIGLAAIIGAFLAGLIFGESQQRDELERAIEPVYQILVPVFFIITGSKVDITSFGNLNVLSLAAGITILAILGKFIGCGLAAWTMGRRSAVIVGVGMAPRGEVGLIVASIGFSSKVFTAANGLYSVIVIMSIVTTLIVPPLLKLLFAGYDAPEDSSTPDPVDAEGLLNQDAAVGFSGPSNLKSG